MGHTHLLFLTIAGYEMISHFLKFNVLGIESIDNQLLKQTNITTKLKSIFFLNPLSVTHNKLQRAQYLFILEKNKKAEREPISFIFQCMK